MKTLLWRPLSSPERKGLSKKGRNLVPFLVLSLIIHLISLGLADWAVTRIPTRSQKEKALVERRLKKKEKKKKEKEKLVYVKILEIPKPKVEEKPKKSHIIAQYNMTRKGPRGKKERSSVSGESSTLNFKPGLPVTPPRPRITLVPGQRPVALPKLEAKKGEKKGGKAKPRPRLAQRGEEKMPPPARSRGRKEGKEKVKKGQREAKGETREKAQKGKGTQKTQEGEKRKLVQVVPERGPQTRIVPPLPRRQIPLFDPSLINEQSNKIVPQMGEGQSQEISLDTTKSKYISYFKHIKDKLYLVWRYPLAARAAGIQGTVHILFVINRQGELTEVRILKSSGFNMLDREAERALRAAAPFGPFPPDWQERELRIRARFIYRLFSSPFQ